MAARDVIHFPLWAQLSPRQSLPVQTPFEPASLIYVNLRRLYGSAPTSSECWLCLPVTSRGGQ